MTRPLRLIGQRFARLLVVSRAANTKQGQARWNCLCDCGKHVTVTGRALVTNNTRSCGCFKREGAAERLGNRQRTHGKSHTLSYSIWRQMIARCTDQENPKFYMYGARGISVCERWIKFENFFEDMGEKPAGLCIERINNNGNYEKGNCKWGTYKEQANNTRRNRRLTYQGQTMTLSDWAIKLGITVSTLHERLTKHSAEVALSSGRWI